MATGLQASTSNGRIRTFRILEAATATNSPPSGASAGVAWSALDSIDGLKSPTYGTLFVYSTAGSGTMDVTVRLWGYAGVGAVWVPLGTGTATAKGLLNNGVAIGETGSDTIRHSEPVMLPSHFDRLYAEVTAINGTSTAVTVDLVYSVTGGL